MKRHIVLPLTLLAALACSKNSPPCGETTTTSNATPNAKPGTTAPADTTKTTSATMPAGAQTAETKPITIAALKFTTGLSAPESVLYDDAMDRYIVSNINGKSTDVDDNGYITVLSPDGKVTTERWIEGGKKNVTLNAPKGLGMRDGMLVVADIDTVRMFDLKTGMPKGEVKIPGATFLNDISVSPDGRIFVSDSGMRAKGNEFEATNTDAVYAIDKANKLKTIAKDASLGRPNGLCAAKDGVWVVTYGSNELYRIDESGKRQDVTRLPKGALDGLLMIGETFYVSSWDGMAIYRGRKGGPFDVLIADVRAPADIGLDSKRSRLLVPRLQDNEVDVFNLQP
jgi:sugar lactone lactonase YvrE